MISYMVGKLAPNLSHLTRGLAKSVPGKGYFCAVPSQNGDKYVTSRPPQSLNFVRSSAYIKDEDGILLRDVQLIRERWVRLFRLS